MNRAALVAEALQAAERSALELAQHLARLKAMLEPEETVEPIREGRTPVKVWSSRKAVAK